MSNCRVDWSESDEQKIRYVIVNTFGVYVLYSDNSLGFLMCYGRLHDSSGLRLKLRGKTRKQAIDILKELNGTTVYDCCSKKVFWERRLEG